MAKNNNETTIPPQQQTAPQTGGDAQEQAVPTPATRAQLFTFWGVVIGVLAAALLLAHFMPGTPERVIERWLMVPFGLFLAFFIHKLK